MANTHQTINPATGETIATYETLSDDQALQALKESHQAFLEWRKTSLEERGAIVREIAKRLRANKDEYAALMTREMGKPISRAAARSSCAPPSANTAPIPHPKSWSTRSANLKAAARWSPISLSV